MKRSVIYQIRWKFIWVVLTCIATEARGLCFVKTKLGAVLGSMAKSRNGNSFCSFRGIPYAAPPIGELRFETPQDPEPWIIVRLATYDRSMCVQKIPVLGIVTGHEDCLYLNIYTPNQDTTSIFSQPSDNLANLPVIVYIHGGQFSYGSGVSYLAGPQYIMDKPVILVTINYRVGVLGFLSTGNDAAPGNYGMKDQVAALRWVRDNIAEFGGDPDRVTIQGQSAGSKSLHFHMFSPLSKGLFHGAIGQSGSAFMPWVLPRNSSAIAKEIAETQGCPTENSNNLIECLRRKEAKDLYQGEEPLWHPVIETESVLNPEPFLVASPLELVQSGDFYKVPWLMGSTAQDGAFFGARTISNEKKLKDFSEHMDVEGPEEFFLKLSMNESLIPDTWQKIKKFYFGSNATVTPEKMIELYTDRYVVHSVHKAAQLHSKTGHSPIYRYNFAYRGFYSFAILLEFGTGFMDLGVIHTDDLIYLLPFPIFNLWPPGHPDLTVIDLMVTLWTNFAIYGNPTPQDGTIDVIWQPLTSSNSSYLQIGHDLSKPLGIYNIRPVKISMENNLYKERMEFWDRLPLRENGA